ncbi:hypothetical protein [Streptacidiphilus sp. EB103A]|uniref:hypothetical protein n=1 Tax=Streptacidiphilus sp. EB103A TaxID=3156275 RepID=UPI003517DB48
MVTAINFLLARPAASLTQTAVQGLTSSAVTALIWPTPTLDTTGMWASGQPTRLTPQRAGYYSITVTAGFVPNATGARMAEICRNGSANIIKQVSVATSGSAFNTVIQVVAPMVYFNGTTDYVEAYVDQNSGTTPLNTVPAFTTFEARWESN